jgi:uncharacterized protein YdcH (DUF465 family)
MGKGSQLQPPLVTNADYRRLAAKHADYARRLQELASQPYLTEEEALEQVRLKKLKLRLKVEMLRILCPGELRELTSGPAPTEREPTGLRLRREFRELARQVPQEEWDQLPKDLLDNLDHYLYGAPKQACS